jgi:hypothetical protein
MLDCAGLCSLTMRAPPRMAGVAIPLEQTRTPASLVKIVVAASVSRNREPRVQGVV